MDISQIENETVRTAIAALQSGDADTWYAVFADEVSMTDNGNPKEFRSFFDGVLGEERFVSIDRVENGGLDLYGDFDAGQLGIFPIFFKFHIGEDGKIDRLDIGQT